MDVDPVLGAPTCTTMRLWSSTAGRRLFLDGTRQSVVAQRRQGTDVGDQAPMAVLNRQVPVLLREPAFHVRTGVPFVQFQALRYEVGVLVDVAQFFRVLPE